MAKWVYLRKAQLVQQQKSFNLICNINRIDLLKAYDHLSSQKMFDKIQHPFMVKALKKKRNRKEFSQPDKGHV